MFAVSRHLLDKLAAEVPFGPAKDRAPLDPEAGDAKRLADWLERRGIEHADVKVDSTGRPIFLLLACAFEPGAPGGSACVGIGTEGGWFFKCQHDSCTGRDWAAFRLKVGGKDEENQLAHAREALASCLEAAKKDVGAPFEPDVAEQLALVRAKDPAAWARARAAFRDLKVSMKTLDRLTFPKQPEPTGPFDASAGYESCRDGFYRVSHNQDGLEVRERLTNFTSRIVASVAEDDGVETRRMFTIENEVHGETQSFDVPSDQFAGLSWVLDRLGPKAIVFSGVSVRDHARVAIQHFSPPAESRHTFTHTGWRQVEGEWVYLHGNGAVGREGHAAAVSVRLEGALAPYALPEPPEGADLAAAVRASLGFLLAAPDVTTFPLFAAAWRAVLGSSDLAVWLLGPSGEGKSELAALVQQHWGPALDRTHLPGSWSSTSNALEGTAFLAKDAVFVVDDFAPQGSPSDVSRMHKDADRLIRSQGNGQGRQRMRADSTLRPAKPPRGLILGTGEDVPAGFSLRARMAVVEVAKGSVSWKEVTRCQADAAAGLYASCMSGFLRWVAADYEATVRDLPARVATIRAAAARDGDHKRTPNTTANLALGLDAFSRFSVATGVMGEAEREAFMARGWVALMALCDSQAQHQQHAEPAARFLALLAGRSRRAAATSWLTAARPRRTPSGGGGARSRAGLARNTSRTDGTRAGTASGGSRAAASTSTPRRPTPWRSGSRRTRTGSRSVVRRSGSGSSRRGSRSPSARVAS